MAITAQFTADFSQFNAAASDAKGNLENLTAAAEGMAIDRQAERAGAALGDLGKQVVSFATDYISAFAEEEAATSRLTSALQAQGNASTETIANYAAMATQFQETTRYSDDAVTAAQTAFTTIGRVGPENMQAAMQAAVDLAAQLGIGLPEAAQKIATVIGTDGAKLGSLKAMLGDVDVKGKSAADVLEIFNKKFGGAAAADMDTTAGKLTNLQNKFDDLKGNIGGVLANALTPLLDMFTSLPQSMQTTIVGVGLLGTALAPIAIAFGSVVSAVVPLVGLLGGASGIAAAIGTVVGTLTGILPILAAVAAAVAAVYVAFKNWDTITGFVKAVYDGIKTYLVDGFNAVLGAITHPIDTIAAKFKWLKDVVVGNSYVPDLIIGISDEFAKLNQVMVEPATKAAEATQAVLGKAMSSIGELAGGALAGAGGGGSSGGVGLPGSHIETVGGMQYLVSPNGYRVPMEKTATGNSVMPANWWAMYTGRESAPLNSMFTGTELATAANNRPPPVNVTINGSVLSTKDELSSMVQDAMMQAYRGGGNLLPV